MFIIHFFHCDSHLAAKPDFLGNLSKKVIESRYIGPKVRAVIDWMGSYPFNIPYNIMIWLLIAIFATKITRMMGHLLFAGFQLPGGRRSVTYTAVWHRYNSFIYVQLYMYVTSLTCQSELAGFYRDADVALVTPLRYDALSSFHPIASHKLPLPVINCHHMQ